MSWWYIVLSLCQVSNLGMNVLHLVVIWSLLNNYIGRQQGCCSFFLIKWTLRNDYQVRIESSLILFEHWINFEGRNSSFALSLFVSVCLFWMLFCFHSFIFSLTSSSVWSVIVYTLSYSFRSVSLFFLIR